MSGELIFVFALLAVTVALFASDKVRLDLVAIGVVLALMLGGILTPREAVAGFGDPVVLLIAGLFVVGEGLFRTGVAQQVGLQLTRAAGSGETRLLVLLMITVAVLSAFMSSTGTVAIMIPVVLSLAARGDLSPSRLLLPVSIASLIGGMLTLIGTPPNLVVSEELKRAGLEPFNFFAFTPIGLAVLAVGIGFMVVVGTRLLPRRETAARAPRPRKTLRDLAEEYGLAGQLHRLAIPEGSALGGRTIAEAQLRTRFGVTVVGIVRQGRIAAPVMPALIDSRLEAGDTLITVAPEEAVARLAEAEGLERPAWHDAAEAQDLARDLGVAEVLVAPESPLVGGTLKHHRFRERYGVSVLAARRGGRPLPLVPGETMLGFGDTLLVGGGWEQIRVLDRARDELIVLALPRELEGVAPARALAPVALAVVVGMLGLMTFEVLPAVTAVLLAATAMVVTGCVRMDEAYRSINWQSLVLIAGMLPMATALEQTGGMALIVDGLIGALGPYGPLVLMAGLFVITSVFSQFISNTATTVLLAPIAIGAAQGLGVSPYALAMTVAIAASTAFATPVASPVNTLVLGPGHYRFTDFVRIGVPLQALAMVVTLLAVPLLFPL